MQELPLPWNIPSAAKAATRGGCCAVAEAAPFENDDL
jgi:hypothetical protein